MSDNAEEAKVCCNCIVHEKRGKKHYCHKSKCYTQEHYTCSMFKKDIVDIFHRVPDIDAKTLIVPSSSTI